MWTSLIVNATSEANTHQPIESITGDHMTISAIIYDHRKNRGLVCMSLIHGLEYLGILQTCDAHEPWYYV